MKVLIAEDNPTSQRILEKLLLKWGLGVEVASDGEQAWSMIQQDDAPPLLLLDWMMPRIDGVELCRRLRRIPTDHPPYIIMVTALGQKEDVVTGLDAGANDYIVKPFHNEELRSRIRVGQRVLELQADLAGRIQQLNDALEHITTLQGILPICMHCHKIHTDQQIWERLEAYIEAHSNAMFSHGICPECRGKYYPHYADDITPGEALG